MSTTIARSFAQRYAVRTDRGKLLNRFYDEATAIIYARSANKRAADMALNATRYVVLDLGEPGQNGRYIDTEER